MNIWQEYYIRQIKVNNASNYQSLKLTFVEVKLARVSLLINVPSHGNRSNRKYVTFFFGPLNFLLCGFMKFISGRNFKAFLRLETNGTNPEIPLTKLLQ